MCAVEIYKNMEYVATLHFDYVAELSGKKNLMVGETVIMSFFTFDVAFCEGEEDEFGTLWYQLFLF